MPTVKRKGKFRAPPLLPRHALRMHPEVVIHDLHDLPGTSLTAFVGFNGSTFEGMMG